MDGHLAGRAFFVGERLSLADLTLYAYTHVARDGGLELGAFPAVSAWLRRAEPVPGYEPLSA